jgi:putative flippase GtrA
MRRQLSWFVLVGAAAAATHMAVVVVLVESLGWAPLAANVAGWMLAFFVSFGGHYRLTFSGSGAALWPAARRFALISFGGFVANQAAYAVLLRFSGLNYALGLFLVLLGVAAATFVLSRWWAFRQHHTGPSAPPAP